MAKSYDLTNLSFLIVEDSQHMRQIIKTILRGFGVTKIYDFADPADGLEAIITRPVDIIILDYKLPTLDGLEFVEMVRNANDSRSQYVPIIMLSAYTDKGTVEKARDVGVTEFLGKPISAQKLYVYIVSCITKPRDFVRSPTYFGPDRRRKNPKDYKGVERRKKISEV